MQQVVKELYPDADRITVSQSATGKGSILRWQYSESTVDVSSVRQHSSVLSLSSLSSNSSGSGNAVSAMTREVPRTPSHRGKLYPPSVFKAPHKRAPQHLQRNADRIGGGIQWWRDDVSGVTRRLVYIPEEVVPAPGQQLSRELEIHNREYMKLLAMREWRERQMQVEEEEEFFGDGYDSSSEEGSSDVDDHEMEVEDGREAGPSKASSSQPGPQPLQFEATEVINLWEPPSPSQPIVNSSGLRRQPLVFIPHAREESGSEVSETTQIVSSSGSRSSDVAPSIYPENPTARFRMVDGKWELEGSLNTPAVAEMAANYGALIDSSLKDTLRQINESSPASSRLQSTVTVQTQHQNAEAGPSRVRRGTLLLRGDTELVIEDRPLPPLGWEPTEILSDQGSSCGYIM